MRKIILSILALVACTTWAFSQSVFNRSTTVANVGAGISTDLKHIVFPPVAFSVETGVADGLFSTGQGSVGVGGYLGIAAYRANHESETYVHTIIGPRASLHYEFIPQLDTYSSLMLGYNMGVKRFAWEFMIGGRYYLNSNLAVMTELGYGITFFNLGVSFRL